MANPRYRFGAHRLDPAARELWRDGERLPLPPKSFDCLAYLVRHRERAIGRDELISAVWGRADVSDAVLAQTLLRVRKALGETASEQGAIRTVPRFGYRWVAATDELSSDAEAGTGTTALAADESIAERTPSTRSLRSSRRALAAVLVALLLGAAATAAWQWRHMKQPAATQTASASSLVVVSPVRIDGATAETSWVRLGVMDYIASRLRDDGRLTVLPSERVVGVSIDGKAATPQQLREVAGAALLVEPEARVDAGRWTLDLRVSGADRADIQVIGRGDTPLVAAAQASAALLERLGRTSAVPPPAQDAAEEGLRRIDAAMLEGNVPAARDALAALPDSVRARPDLRVRDGQLRFRAGRIDEAATIFTDLQQRLAELPIDVQAQALMGLGAVAVRRGDFPTAERRYAEALAVLGSNGSQELTGNGYSGRGVARAAQQQFDLALADFGRARIALERAGDSPGAASVDTNVGLLQSRRGQWTQALQSLDRAIAVFERYGIEDSLAATLLAKGRTQLLILDSHAALASSERANRLLARIENHVLAASIIALQVEVQLRTGALAAAARTLATIEPVDIAGLRSLRIELALARGEFAQALSLAQAQYTAQPDGEGALLLVRAAIATGDVRTPPASALAEPAADAVVSDAASRLLARALWSAAHGETETALARYEDAIRRADRDASPDLRVDIASRAIEYLVGQGRLERASELGGQLAAYAETDYRAARAAARLYAALGDSGQLALAQVRLRELAGERDPQQPRP